MKNLSLFLIILFLNPSYGNQKSNRTPHDVINLNQLDLKTLTDFRDETYNSSFIQSTMDAQFIPGLSISIAKGGNIVWDKHFGYANINDSTLVDKNTMFILSSASKTVTGASLMHLYQAKLIFIKR